MAGETRKQGRGAIAAAVAVAMVLAAGAGWWYARGRPPRGWVSYAAAEVKRAPNPHAYKGGQVCQACHQERSAALKGAETPLCQGCHTFHHGNHPVDVTQAASVDLPLGAGQRVACHTCHDQHDVKKARAGLRKPFNQLCVTCHKGH